jgi:hypothetical protein
VGLFGKRGQPDGDPVPPGGVVLHLNGREIPCDVLRDPDQDRRGETAWLAVPAETVTVQPGDEIRVTAALLPAGAKLIVDCVLPRPAERDEWWLPDTY